MIISTSKIDCYCDKKIKFIHASLRLRYLNQNISIKIIIKCQTVQFFSEVMADRQRFCIGIMSLLTLCSAGYLGYYIFLHPDNHSIDKYNRLRFYVFFGQHLITFAMMIWEIKNDSEQQDRIIKWIFKLSSVVVMMFVGCQVFVVARGGRFFGNRIGDLDNLSDTEEMIIEFQINQTALYFQIMTDFVIFFIMSAIAMAVFKYRDINTQERYEFMIDNLKSQDFVDEPNAAEKKSCAICLTDLEGQRVLKLPCDHIFHKECLVNWLKRSSVCPMCRNDIEQSLSPTIPLRFPPQIHSQPILLPPPSPAVIAPRGNQLIQPRPIIPLNNRNRIQDYPNQNQIIRNQNRISEQNEGRNVRFPERHLENLTELTVNQPQMRQKLSERDKVMRSIKSQTPYAVTQRRNQPEQIISHKRPVSSNMTRQIAENSSFPIPNKVPSPKIQYSNPNQRLNHQ